MTSRPNLLRLVALIACLSLARGAQATVVTAYGVDSSLGGGMNFVAALPVYNNSQTQFTITLTAVNNGATPYHGVALALEFFYPADPNTLSGLAVGNGFQYLASENGTWADNPTSPTRELQFTGATSTDFPTISYGLQLLSPSQINVPLTDTNNDPGGPYTAGPLAITDSVPLIQLGDFAPGHQVKFTLSANSLAGGNFHFTGDEFFVAVPEPSSIVLCGLGMIALLWAGRRKRRSNFK